MEQRFEFVLQWAKHETSMAELCRTFGISRQTGYGLVTHFQAEGLDGLKPHSRAPHHPPNAIAEEVCAAVLRAKAAHPSWGPKKLMPLLDEPDSIQEQWPVASTRGAILTRAGLTVPRRPPRAHVPPRTQPFGSVEQANDTWCADFKGWFRTADGGHRAAAGGHDPCPTAPLRRVSARVQPRPTPRGIGAAAASRFLCTLTSAVSQTPRGTQLSRRRPGAAGASHG